MSGDILRKTALFVAERVDAGVDALLASQYLQAGRRALQKADYLQALSGFYKAVRIDSGNVGAYLGIAEAYRKTGNHMAALRTLKQGWKHTGSEKLLKAARAVDYVIEWEDEALEALVREYLGKTDGDISWSEVRGIKELDINGIYIVRKDEQESSCGVVSQSKRSGLVYYFRTDKRSIDRCPRRGKIVTLRDIRHFSSLERLTVFYNEIQDISGLEKLTKLQYLFLGYNNICNINVLVRLSGLTTLILYSNRIKNIRVLGKLTRLTVLEIYDNQVEDIGALAALTDLTRLYLHKNRIRDVAPLAELTSLETLFLYNNRIRDVSPLSGLKNLEHLFLWGNRIKDFSPVSFVPDLLREWG